MKTPPPISLDQVTPEWLAIRREIVVRGGYALRAGTPRATIEIKSLVTNEWCVLTLPDGADEFASAAARGQVLARLTGEAR